MKHAFLLSGILFVIVSLTTLFFLSLHWLPPGYALAGHDSGLPLDSKQFLLTRLSAWDDRLGFGLDNSANFGSLTIHTIDLISSLVAGVPYAGNFVSLFFWLGLIFLSGFIFAYQLKDTLGKSFVFIFPIILVFNFYIFQSVFMLERAKFGILSATLIFLAIYLGMKDKKLPILVSSIIAALAFSIFNGGGWFGITLYGGVVIILFSLVFINLIEGVISNNLLNLKRTLLFFALTAVFYLLFNAYSILSYSQNFLSNDVPRLLQESSSESHKDWLRYVSRSTSFINLFTLFAVPDWYGEVNDLNRANLSHAYAPIYLNNKTLLALSFIFPLLTFSSLLLAKTKKQKQIIGFFGLVTFLGVIFAAGSNSPLGFLYEFLMDHVPGFILFRSAFYKFGIFYMLGMMVMFAFTVSFLIDKLTDKIKKDGANWIWGIANLFCIVLFLGLWLSYHFVLFDTQKIFAWKPNQSTKFKVPEYIYSFADWVEKNNLEEQRILLLPPVNSDWQNDAYNWGYWSLSPLSFSLTSARVLSNWHGLTSEELTLVDDLYNAIKQNDKIKFSNLADRLNVGYILARQDILTDSTWSAAESLTENRKIIETFANVSKVENFGQWDLYRIQNNPSAVLAVSSINVTSDSLVTLVNKYFGNQHTVGSFARKNHPEIDNISLNKIEAFDCLSCLLERQDRLKSLPDVNILPNSFLYFLKENREIGVLDEITDPKTRIGNYLGLILRSTAELKRMLDLSVREEYSLESMGTIRSYLNKLYSDIRLNQENAYDFVMLKQILDFLNPVERMVSDYMKTNLSRTHTHRFGEEMLGVVWDINQIKEYFTPILQDTDRWSEEKIYKVNFPEDGEYTLLFSASSFPLSPSGDIIFPKLVEFSRDDQKEEVKIKRDGEDWLVMDIGFQNQGSAQLTLYFKKLPNLFNLEGSELEKFFYGKVACLRGNIGNFDRKRAYQVLISKTDRLRSVRVIFRDKNKVYSEKHGFLKGEDLFEIPSVVEGQLSKYIYYPSSIAKDIYLYICSDDQSLPEIGEIIIQEFFSPSVISIKKPVNSDTYLPPEVKYTRINPVHYEVETKNIQGAYVLLFNEKFNSSWRLTTEDDSDKVIVLDKHFMVDGYANGWLIEDGNRNKFKIEYTSQSSFYLGSIISVISFLLVAGLLIYRRIKKGD